MYSKLTPIRPQVLYPKGQSFDDPKGWTDVCTSGTGPVSVEITMDYDTGESTVSYFAVYLTASTEYTFYGTGTYSNARIDVYDSAGTKVAYNQGDMTEPEWEWVVSDCVYTPSESGVYVFAVLDGSEMGDMGDTYNMYVTPRPSEHSMAGPTPYENSTGFDAMGSALRYRSANAAKVGCGSMPDAGLIFYAPLQSKQSYAETGQALTTSDGLTFVSDSNLGTAVALGSGWEPNITCTDMTGIPDGTASRTESIWIHGSLGFSWFFSRFAITDGQGNISLRTGYYEAITEFTGGITANTWHNVAYTYDGTNAKLYVDGVLVDTNAVATIPRPSTLTIFGTDMGFTGRLSSARIYNRALKPWEMERLASEFSIS